jgi:hypothetical protein
MLIYFRHHARRYEKRPYTCDECDKSFLYPKDLRRHKTTHTGSKQYRCRLCTKSFSRKDNLRRHCHNEHGVTNVPLSPDLVAVDISGNRGNHEAGEELRREIDHRPQPQHQQSFSMPRTDAAEPSGGNSQTVTDAAPGAIDNVPKTQYLPPSAELENPPDSYYIPNTESTPYDPRKGDGSNHPTIGDADVAPSIEDPEEEAVSNPDVNADLASSTHQNNDDGQFLICPWRRWKPLVYRKCNGKFKDHAKVIHHLKQSHKIYFHATCVQRFLTRDELYLHLDQEACCRSCRKHFGSRERKDKHIKETHDSRPGQDPKPEQPELWQSIYEQCCGDTVKHNPYWGKDFDGAEEEAKRLYPVEYYKPLVPGSPHTDRSMDTEGLSSETTGPRRNHAAGTGSPRPEKQKSSRTRIPLPSRHANGSTTAQQQQQDLRPASAITVASSPSALPAIAAAAGNLTSKMPNVESNNAVMDHRLKPGEMTYPTLQQGDSE